MRKILKLAVRKAYKFALTFQGPFGGVWNSYEDAVRAIPPKRLSGYDHAELGRKYFYVMDGVRSSDYPLLLWLDRALSECRSVFDYGGNIGVSYYRFGRHVRYPADLRWRVYDLPEITKVGQEVAREKGNPPLTFTNCAEDAAAAEILLAIGSVQYIPAPFAKTVAALWPRPKHILINRIPLYDGPDFVTLEDISEAVCAYQVFNRDRFVGAICELGYELVDSWSNFDQPCHIPWRLQRSFQTHTGLYFRAC